MYPDTLGVFKKITLKKNLFQTLKKRLVSLNSTLDP